ncbi:MAG: cobalamin biosynthesis protein, partial [Methanomassiliicoccus sp.]
MQSEGKAPTRFVVLGGYLGAGKTTLAAALGKELRSKYGKSVAIITNDQGNVLVDTEYMKNAGFDVKDVLGGCFCANFGEFVKNARTLVSTGRPDVIIAEPIGTSTAILGSVVAPLRTMYPDEFQVAPFFVVVDGT